MVERISKCRKCQEVKPQSEFPNYQVRGVTYKRSSCKICWANYLTIRRSEFRVQNLERERARDKRRYYENKNKRLTPMRTHYRKLKALVFEHYGYMCDCCGETEPVFLTLDHKENDGAEHRYQIGAGAALFKWIVQHDFPNSIRVLCFNCNAGRYHNGGKCPHEDRHADIIPVGWKQKEG